MLIKQVVAIQLFPVRLDAVVCCCYKLYCAFQNHMYFIVQHSTARPAVKAGKLLLSFYWPTMAELASESDFETHNRQQQHTQRRRQDSNNKLTFQFSSAGTVSRVWLESAEVGIGAGADDGAS